MLRNAEAAALMRDARAAQAEGERLWAAGDWRAAAAQGWAAVREATAALALEVTGAHYTDSEELERGLIKLAQERGGEWERMCGGFSEAAYVLHYETYHGRVHHDDLDELLREAWEYVRCAEELAGRAAGVAADLAVGGGEGC